MDTHLQSEGAAAIDVSELEHEAAGLARDRATGLVALLDPDGVIVAVNDAWTSAALERGGHPARTGVGVSYLDVCAGAADDEAEAVATALRRALAGELMAPLQLKQSCAAPGGAASDFDVWIGSRYDDRLRCVGSSVVWAPVGDGGDGPSGPAVPIRLPVDRVRRRAEVALDLTRQLLADPTADPRDLVLATLCAAFSADRATVEPRPAAGPIGEGHTVGPQLRVPFPGRGSDELVLSRSLGSPPFTAAERADLTAYADSAVRSLQLAEARLDRDHRRSVADRDRRLAELYERAAQEIFAATLLLSSVTAGVADEALRRELAGVVDELDRGIGRLRRAVFAPTPPDDPDAP